MADGLSEGIGVLVKGAGMHPGNQGGVVERYAGSTIGGVFEGLGCLDAGDGTMYHGQFAQGRWASVYLCACVL